MRISKVKETAAMKPQSDKNKPLAFTEAVRQLNLETDQESQNWYRGKRKVYLPVIFGKMILGFIRTYLFKGAWRHGFSGLMRAVNGSLYHLVTYVKYWELTERERGRM